MIKNSCRAGDRTRDLLHAHFGKVAISNDSPQDALEFEYRIGVQIYKLVRFCIFDTFGNYLTPNETMWQYNLSTQKN